jgi:DNA (cytosine-5)-methyltransferase 1
MLPVKKTVVEICAGAGGQALGLELAGFHAVAAVEIDPAACATLRLNRPDLRVIEGDVRSFDGREFSGVDLLAGGVPCPPFSIAGKQLGKNDERDLFPEALRLVKEIQPRAVMLENVKGFASEKFKEYRDSVLEQLRALGYVPTFQVLQASDLGVPQLRPRFILVALRADDFSHFRWDFVKEEPKSVGRALVDLMKANGWKGAQAWSKRADTIAPTLVGGSKKHGGPDLGPTRAKRQWAELGVDGMGVANEAPAHDFPDDAMPRLTVRMAARIQGFPDYWNFSGKKTAAYRQVGNAFPPPVARFVASRIMEAFEGSAKNMSPYTQPEPSQMMLLEGRAQKKLPYAQKKRIKAAHS